MNKDILRDNDRNVPERINKFLSDAGVCSRREADRMIDEGRVFIDGVKAEHGQKILPGQDITIDGRTVKRSGRLVLIALNKPKGIVCTSDRVREKNNIIDFVHYPERIYPVGRLDKDSEGLILLTNDGGLADKIMKSGMLHEKEYIVRVNKPLNGSFLKGMSSGVPILDTITRKCTVKRIDKYTFSIVLTQGLNRQIRRMCEYFGYKVVSLKRVRIMNIRLGHLKTGTWRNVTAKEINGLKAAFEKSSMSKNT